MANEKKKEKLFGTDGVRGHANLYPMTVETAVLLGKAIALHLRRTTTRPRVVIGKDTRLSCYMFENALIAGLTSMGADTLMVGPLPTPGVAFITRAYRANAGIVISASHNPFYDNGIKIFTHDGFKLPDGIENEIALMVDKNEFFSYLPENKDVGRNKRIADSDGRYIEFVKATFPKGKNLRGFKIFLDCAHGACHRVAPLVFSELDAAVMVIGNEPNGININDHCGALYPEEVQRGVLDQRADIGIALDGDGDRVILIDELGNVVDGDTILAISAFDLKTKGELKNNRVVATQMTNFGVLQFLKENGIEVFLSKVGDRYVIQEMLAQNAFLGGEQSGHMIFLDHNPTGDGIVSALQVLRIMSQNSKPLSVLSAAIKKVPQKLVNVRSKCKPPLESLIQAQKVKMEAEKELGDRGRVLLRYSGTENLCRVLVEGFDSDLVNRFAEKIAVAVKTEIGE